MGIGTQSKRTCSTSGSHKPNIKVGGSHDCVILETITRARRGCLDIEIQSSSHQGSGVFCQVCFQVNDSLAMAFYPGGCPVARSANLTYRLLLGLPKHFASVKDRRIGVHVHTQDVLP